MAIANLRICRTVDLPDEPDDPLIERLTAAGAQMAASQITYARTDPRGDELAREQWAQIRAVLDTWATEEDLHPRLEQIRQLVAPDPT
jgi:hypothetical protein